MSKEKIIKQMVNSFLSWKLPEDLIPDGGITYKKIEGFSPIGTNLLTATQAEAMVRHMLSHVGVSDLVATDSSQEPPLESAQSNKADTNDINEALLDILVELVYGTIPASELRYVEQAKSQAYLEVVGVKTKLKHLIAQETNKAVVAELEELMADMSQVLDQPALGDLSLYVDLEINRLTADKEQNNG